MDNDKITKEIWYQFLVLKILIDLGGEAEANRVIGRIGRKYRDLLTEKDLMVYDSGSAERWKNYTQFARQHLKEEGYLRSDSPHGIWEITDEGKEKYKEWFEFIQKNLPQKKEAV